MVRQVRNENRGAGFYGGERPSHVTNCVNSKNPHGHNKECPCGWWVERASQSVPYMEGDD